MPSPTDPQTFTFEPSDPVPNHPCWSLLLYRGALENKTAAEVEEILTQNGWAGTWRDGVYPYHHYHTTSHEVLVVTSGEAQVMFGGPQGETIELSAGDVAVLPAGTGHRCLDASRDFEVVGAYPKGQENWDLRRSPPGEAELQRIAALPPPQADPIYGTEGLLVRLWR